MDQGDRLRAGGRRTRRALGAAVAALLCAAVVATAAAEPAPPLATNLVREDVFGGSSDFDWPVDVESDAAGRVYFAGYTASPDFPRKAALPIRHADSDPSDNLLYTQGFVRRYAPNGVVLYSTLLPPKLGSPNGFSVTDDGAVYAVGDTWEPGTPYDGAGVVKVSASGREVEYSTMLGGDESYAFGIDIAAAPDGGAYVVGIAPRFPVTSGAWAETPFPAESNFIARLSPSGEMTAATYIPHGATTIDVAPSGDVYVGGDAHPGAFGDAPGVVAAPGVASRYDGFIARFSPDLSQLRFASYVGAGGDDRIEGIDVGADGVVHAVGTANGDSLQEVNPLETLSEPGERFDDVMYVELSPDGEVVRQLARIGTAGPDVGTDLELGPDGAVLISAHKSSYDIPVHGSLPDRPHAPGFAVRIQDGAMTHLTTYGDPSVTGNVGGGITATSDGLVHIGDFVKTERDRPTIDLRLEALQMNPFVDEPEVTVPSEQGARASLSAEAGAREDVETQGWAVATIRKGKRARAIRLESAPAEVGAYDTAPLALRPRTERGRKRLREALGAGKRIRVETKVRFEDSQGTVAIERHKQTVSGASGR